MEMEQPRAAKWPELSIPDWLQPRTEELIAKVGEDHADVQFFKRILEAGRIDEATLDALTKFIVDAKSDEASEIAIDLSLLCTVAVGVVAGAGEVLREHRIADSDPHAYKLHCSRTILTTLSRARAEILKRHWILPPNA